MSKKPIFRNYGGCFQLVIESAADLRHVLALDDSLWVANSAPVDSLQMDRLFLKMLDSDHNKRIRVDEVRAAISWLLEMLRDKRGIDEGWSHIPIASINTSHEQGRAMKAAALRVLANIGVTDRTKIRVDQLQDRGKLLQMALSNGDGVITPNAVDDDFVAMYVERMMDVMGSQTDINGRPGIDEGILVAFTQEARLHLDWLSFPEKEGGEGVCPLGGETDAGLKLLESLKPKIDAYFNDCRLAVLEQAWQTGSKVWSPWPPVAKGEEGNRSLWLEQAPLAKPRTDMVLDLLRTENPYFSAMVDQFRDGVVRPILGSQKESMTQAEWAAIQSAFEPYCSWIEAKAGTRVEKLGRSFLEGYFSEGVDRSLKNLIETDRAVAEDLSQVDKIHQLCLYQANMLEFVNNFVSLPSFFDPAEKAQFEMGTLIMDGRVFGFSIGVNDLEIHSKMAKESRLFLLYCELTRAEAKTPLLVATAVTHGGRGNLTLGKRGVFYTCDGLIWDARVLKVLEQPISLSEAFKQPFKRVGRYLGSKVDEFSVSGEKHLESALDSHLNQIDDSVKQSIHAVGESAKPPASTGSGIRDAVMGISVAVAAMGSAFAFITKTFSELKLINIAVAVVVGCILIVVPAVIGGLIKLRRRDIAAVLEASGWAINAKIKLTAALCKVFTQDPPLPKQARFDRQDIIKRLARKLISR